MVGVMAIKVQQWVQKGVTFKAAHEGRSVFVSEGERLDKIAADHTAAIERRMFFSVLDDFDTVISRL
jgi:hypothetical protein